MNSCRNQAVRLVLATIVVSGLVGCGLPASGKVDKIASAEVPFDLLATAAPGQSPQPKGPPAVIYLVRGNHLVAANRHVIGENVPAEAIRLLLTGPLSSEAAGGLSSDVPTGTRLVSLDLNGSVAAVELNSEFGGVGGSDQVLAVAQIVYTLTASRYIDAVVFAISGKRIEVPDGSGSLSSAPMRRSDYPHLLVSR